MIKKMQNYQIKDLYHKPDCGSVPFGHDIKTSALGCGKYSLKECSWVQNPNPIDPYSQKHVRAGQGQADAGNSNAPQQRGID